MCMLAVDVQALTPLEPSLHS